MKKSNVETEKQPEGADAPEPSEGAEPAVALEPGSITQEQLTELKDLAAKADEHWQRLLRTSADFENFKKRTTREKQDAIKFANESLLQKLVPVLDNFDMALSATQAAPGDAAQSLQTGINMIYQQLKNALGEAGLEEVDASGKAFDPNLHEAVSQKDTTEVPEGTVVQQLRKGYKLRERLLRPASVVVARKPAA
jgi:molecular chaperone GrpE